MSKKKLSIIIIGVVICVAALSAVLVMVKGKKEKAIDIGKSSGETDEQSYWNPDIHSIAKSEEGYYFLTYDVDGTTLKYFDDATHRTIAVCAKPDCTHDNSDCNAFFSMDYLSSPVYYYKGYIYMVRVDGGMAKVVRIQKDGSKREDVADLFANDGVTSISMVFHDDCIYAYDHLGHTASDEVGKEVIKKIELRTGQSEEAFSYEGKNAAISGARSFGDKLFFKILTYSLDRDKGEINESFLLYCYDYGTGNAEVISDKNISDYYVDTENGVLFYFVIGKGLYSRKLNGTDSTLLYKADETIIRATMSYDGNYLYMSNGGAGSATDYSKKIERKIFVLKTDGTVVNTIALDKNSGTAYFGDEKYMFFAKTGGELVYIDKNNILGDCELKKLRVIKTFSRINSYIDLKSNLGVIA